jgi:uncharacterized coiled-coil protein SlyX
MAHVALEERMIELESRFMHMERLLEKLDEVLLEHQGVLERLTLEVRALREGAQAAGDHQES